MIIKSLFIFLFSVSTCFASIKGFYDLKVDISGNIFPDKLFISQVLKNTNTFKGTFIAPNAFSSEIIGKIEKNNIIKGEFFATENGGRYKVFLEAKIFKKCRIKGALFTEKRKFADFKGKKRGCDE